MLVIFLFYKKCDKIEKKVGDNMINPNKLAIHQKEISQKILDAMYPNEPFEDPIRLDKALKDIEWLLLFIKEAITFNQVTIIENLLAWLKRLFHSLSIEEHHVALLFRKTKEILSELYKDNELDQFLSLVNTEKIRENIEINASNPFEEDMRAYLNALILTDRKKAFEIVYKLVENHVSIEDIYVYVFQEAMRHVGLLWLDGKISVGKEHYCTAVTQHIMSTLYERIFESKKTGKRLLACTVGSELHELGIRMVADIFELNGWDTDYLGPNLPAKEIVDFAVSYKPNIIALSVTMPYHISILKETIQYIKESEELKQVKILVGGYPFIEDHALVEKVGADAFASDARIGLEIANKLI